LQGIPTDKNPAISKIEAEQVVKKPVFLRLLKKVQMQGGTRWAE
jgi:hypothetical protein